MSGCLRQSFRKKKKLGQQCRVVGASEAITHNPFRTILGFEPNRPPFRDSFASVLNLLAILPSQVSPE